MSKWKTEETRYFWVSFLLTLLSNRIVFWGGRLLTRGRPHYSLALPADAVFPFLPWTIVVYIGCFGFWFLVYCLAARLPRERADRFFCANLLSKAVCLLIFVLVPTSLIRPEVSGTTVWEYCVRWLYALDAPDSLFPSVHCLIAWLCWAGVRGDKTVSPVWRGSAAVMAVLVCISTLTLRQHVLLDLFAGVLVGEIGWRLSGLPAVRGVYARLADGLVRLLAPRPH